MSDRFTPGQAIKGLYTDRPYTVKDVVPTTDSGVKHDTGKLPLELLDVAALEGVAKVLQFGAKKYAPNNWRKGLAYTRVLGATLRHLFAWARGEDLDPETGLSHVDHALCELMFLSSYIKTGRTELDDRVKAGTL